MNTTNGDIHYAVVEVDRLGDFPARPVQVPLQSLNVGAKGERLN